MDDITYDQVLTYFKGACSEEERDKVEKWLADPKNEQKVHFILSRIWAESTSDTSEVNDLTHLLTNIHEKIKTPLMDTPHVSHSGGVRNWKQLLRIAAIMLIPIMSVFTYYMFSHKTITETHISDTSFARSNPPGQRSKFTLPDGSKVWLSGQSKLSYRETSDGKLRTIQLEGEAFFDVVKNFNKPFIVQTKQVEVKVFGTSFNVSAYPDDTFTQTTVSTGLVGVRKSKIAGNEGFVYLHPNEQATYSAVDDLIRLDTVNLALFTSWKEGELRFKDDQLVTIAKKLSRWYGVSITLDPSIAHERLTFTVRDESLEKILDHVKAVLNTNYEMVQGKEIKILAR